MELAGPGASTTGRGDRLDEVLAPPSGLLGPGGTAGGAGAGNVAGGPLVGSRDAPEGVAGSTSRIRGSDPGLCDAEAELG